MSKEMLQSKVSGDQGFVAESSPVVLGKEKEKKRGRLGVLLISVGLGMILLAGIALFVYVNSFGGSIFVGPIVSSISTTTTVAASGDGVTKPNSALPGSFKATDSKGNVIEENSVTNSDGITIRGYSDREYDPGLQCSIDSFHIYCSDGGAISMFSLHPGKHMFTVIEHSSEETIVRGFSWESIAT